MLLKFGELALKGRNRPSFVAVLERNLRLSGDLGRIEIRRRGGVFIVTGGEPQETLVERCLALPGVSVVQPGLRCERDPSAAADAAVELLRGPPRSDLRGTDARRRDKRYPLRSMELSRVIGDAVRVRLGLGVDLSEPDLELHIEVDHKEMLVSCERLRGAGGLPVGSSGARSCCSRAGSTRRWRPTG